jgi:hypothetical protein
MASSDSQPEIAPRDAITLHQLIMQANPARARALLQAARGVA